MLMPAVAPILSTAPNSSCKLSVRIPTARFATCSHFHHLSHGSLVPRASFHACPRPRTVRRAPDLTAGLDNPPDVSAVSDRHGPPQRPPPATSPCPSLPRSLCLEYLTGILVDSAPRFPPVSPFPWTPSLAAPPPTARHRHSDVPRHRSQAPRTFHSACPPLTPGYFGLMETARAEPRACDDAYGLVGPRHR